LHSLLNGWELESHLFGYRSDAMGFERVYLHTKPAGIIFWDNEKQALKNNTSKAV
jgi:hypothetical protein